MRHLKLIIIFLIFPAFSIAQNTIGLPDVINYNKQTYNGGLQNWDIKQDSKGIIYIANNEGLLTFDGNYWSLFPLPNRTIVRSIFIKTDVIYVGGQGEMGYFKSNNNGVLIYYSLNVYLSENDKSYGDIWDIAEKGNYIFFRSQNKIYKFSIENKTFTSYEAKSEWSFLETCNGLLFVQDIKNGLLVFDNNIWKPFIEKNTLPTNDPITSILSISKDSILISTLKNGLFIISNKNILPYNTSLNSIFYKERIYSAVKLKTEQFVFATTYGGIYITDSKGNIIQTISIKEGLQNNNVLSVFYDRQENLWLGLDNGIDCIIYNSAIKQIKPNAQIESGYTSIIHNNKLFIGTTNGLFSAELSFLKDISFTKANFNTVNNTKGQTWNLAEINNELLMGHHEGAFVIKNNSAVPISSHTGFWNFVPLTLVYPTSTIVSGNYKGISFLQYSNSNFIINKSSINFSESSRYLIIDDEKNIWVSHPYRGIFKIKTTDSLTISYKSYTQKNGLPSLLNNHVFKIRNQFVVATEKGIYIYNKSKDSFEPSPFFKPLIGKLSIRYLKEDNAGNIWFVHDKKLGVLNYSNHHFNIIYFPELTNKLLSGFEFIYPYNQNNIFVSGEKGIYHINFEKYKSNLIKPEAIIRSVKISNISDSLIFGEFSYQKSNLIPEIKKSWKSISFEFTSPIYGQQSNLEYSYRLLGLEKNWSMWTRKTEKEFNNLPQGKYIFEVKVRSNLGNESAITQFAFIILPKWYETKIAFAFYTFFSLFLIYFILKKQKKKFKKQQAKFKEEQTRINYLHQLEISKAESEIVTIKNEKLNTEIEFKNSELASSAMHLVQKGELLTKIKAELEILTKVIENEKAQKEIKKLIKVLNNEDNKDQEWEHFAQHFDKVHSDFLISLKEKYPTITANELKLSAYLRMNLSSKEIAQLMNISIRGIEISRYRLRKKLDISSAVNLFDFLIQIS